MNPLATKIAERIGRRGPITFAEFMHRALYDPEHGYYAGGRATTGRGGDYFTNVSVGPLFGRLLMRQFAEMWQRLGRPEVFTVVEQGAHMGDFAFDVLEGAQRLEPSFHAALEYIIIEPLPAPTLAQQARLAHFKSQVKWVPSLYKLPPFTGVHFSNELLDAFPVQVIRRQKGEWMERHVNFQDSRFVWIDLPATDEALRTHLTLLPKNLPDGYTTEVNLHAAPWLDALARRLQRGWVLAIDYGYPRAEYYRPERSAGTLSAYRKHQRVEEPLTTPGEIDLTAHVDFTTLAEASRAAGLHLTGFADQHHLMAGLARLHFHDTETLTPELQKENRAFKTVMHPNFLGAAFKAICFSRSAPEAPLSGFAFGNAADRL